MVLLKILIALVLIIVTIVLWVKKLFNYWADRGVPFVKPSFPYGNLKKLVKPVHISVQFNNLYNELKDKCPDGIGGIYFSIRPAVIVTDLDLLKTMMVKDFEYFNSRGLFLNEKDEPLTANLLTLHGPRWKFLRSKLTPTFTSGKMKMMFPTIINIANQFIETLDSDVKKNSEIEMKDLFARFSTDVIGSCAFGIDCNSLKDPECIFRKMANKMINVRRYSRLKVIILAEFPKLATFLGYKMSHDDCTAFFKNVVQDTIENREKDKTVRRDFMDLLIKMKKPESVTETDDATLTLTEIAAQAILFFLAGFETTSTLMTHFVHALSLHQEIQETARECVRETLKKYDGKLTYESILEMRYLDQCIDETFRQNPPAAFIRRKVTKDYLVPNSKIVLQKGIPLIISTMGFLHDPEYFPNPEKFDPDRFTPEEVAKRHPFAFLPFGEGPRICIGQRFAMMEARIGLAMLLNNFKFSTCSKSEAVPEFGAAGLIRSVNKMWLRLERI